MLHDSLVTVRIEREGVEPLVNTFNMTVGLLLSRSDLVAIVR